MARSPRQIADPAAAQGFRTDVLKDLRETQAKIAELQNAQARRQTNSSAPISERRAGSSISFRRTIGRVIAKGRDRHADRSAGRPLVVEARVAPPDIDQVESGAPVRVRIGAGNRRTTPDLEGKVTVVSPDLAHDSLATPKGVQDQQYYLVRVALSEATLKAAGDLQLVPGRPVEVYIRTQDRTPLDYLVKPLHEQLARTFRER